MAGIEAMTVASVYCPIVRIGMTATTVTGHIFGIWYLFIEYIKAVNDGWSEI
ncbi:MAG: hypothetical protein GY943_17185 [Chloroflexi bacterium]|nr:hypothetical protein [Chloroflexota bacterium]